MGLPGCPGRREEHLLALVIQITEANEANFTVFCQHFVQYYLTNQTLLKFPGIPDREFKLSQFPIGNSRWPWPNCRGGKCRTGKCGSKIAGLEKHSATCSDKRPVDNSLVIHRLVGDNPPRTQTPDRNPLFAAVGQNQAEFFWKLALTRALDPLRTIR